MTLMLLQRTLGPTTNVMWALILTLFIWQIMPLACDVLNDERYLNEDSKMAHNRCSAGSSKWFWRKPLFSWVEMGYLQKFLSRWNNFILSVPLKYVNGQSSWALWITSCRVQFINGNLLAGFVRMQTLPQLSNFVLIAGGKNIWKVHENTK